MTDIEQAWSMAWATRCLLAASEDVHDDRDDERQRRGDARVHGAGII